MPHPVSYLMGRYGIVAFSVADGLQLGHLHEVAAFPLKGPVSSVPNISTRAGQEPFGEFHALKRGRVRRLRPGVTVGRQAFNLFSVKHRVAL
jgi:hypothetical protein